MHHLERTIPVIIPAFEESEENLLATLQPIKELLENSIIREVVLAVSDKEGGETMKKIALEAVKKLGMERWVTVLTVRTGKGNALFDAATYLHSKGYAVDTKVYAHDADLYNVKAEHIQQVLEYSSRLPHALARGVITGSPWFQTMKGKKKFTGFQFISQFLFGQSLTGMRTFFLKDLFEIQQKLGEFGYGTERMLNYINTREKRTVRRFVYWGAWQEGKASKLGGKRRDAVKVSTNMHREILLEHYNYRG
jgi:hypothetical protein